MSMFMNFEGCFGECCVCMFGGVCLMGNHEESSSFLFASKKEIIRRLNESEYENYREYMINFLLTHYGYKYKVKEVYK